MADSDPTSRAKTVPGLASQKRKGQKIAALTAYDATFAAIAERAGVDLLLVGDSLGMVVQGHDSTLPVSIDDVLYHCRAVCRGAKRSLVVADLPFGSYPTPLRAFDSARRAIGDGGAAMVKLEGAGPMLDSIEFLATRDVPVCAHLGLTPQSVLALGGYRVQGRESAAAEQIMADAVACAAAGASLLVLECVPDALAAAITAEIEIPTIGIGAGTGCDGQILVLYDLLGLTSLPRPRFVRDFLAGAQSAEEALRNYVAAVRAGTFPGPDESYG